MTDLDKSSVLNVTPVGLAVRWHPINLSVSVTPVLYHSVLTTVLASCVNVFETLTLLSCTEVAVNPSLFVLAVVVAVPRLLAVTFLVEPAEYVKEVPVLLDVTFGVVV